METKKPKKTVDKKEVSIKESIANLETQLALYAGDKHLVAKIKLIISRLKAIKAK